MDFKRIDTEQRVIGIDIGGTKIAAALVSREGQVSHAQTVLTPAAEGADAVMQVVTEQIQRLMAIDHTQVLAIGVGTTGLVDFAQGIVVYAGAFMPGYAGTPIAARLEAAFGVPVVVENDVNAMAISEIRYGASRDIQSALYVTVGTGVGGALVLNGELWRGVNWAAGELGHVVAVWEGGRLCNCGGYGHIEAYASGPAIAREYYRLRGLLPSADLVPVAEAAKQGDKLAQDLIEEGARLLGTVLGGLMNVFDPQVLMVGGGVAGLGDLWWRPFEQAIRANPVPGPNQVLLVRAQAGANTILMGAAALAWERV